MYGVIYILKQWRFLSVLSFIAASVCFVAVKQFPEQHAPSFDLSAESYNGNWRSMSPYGVLLSQRSLLSTQRENPTAGEVEERPESSPFFSRQLLVLEDEEHEVEVEDNRIKHENVASIEEIQIKDDPLEGEAEADGDLGIPPSGLCKNANNLPNVLNVLEWRTHKERSRESLTLMTHLSVDRLSMLENQCRTWPDPLVAVVYTPLYRNSSNNSLIVPTFMNTTLEDVIRGLDSFHMFMESTGLCALHMQLVGQLIDPLNPEEYPINSLRNLAIMMAETDLVFMLDVDFIAAPNLGLSGLGYKDPVVYNQMVELTSQRRALVVPAFEITNRKQNLGLAQNVARSMVVGGKAVIRQSWYAGNVDAFNGQDAPWGHGPTNTSRWIDIKTPITYRAYYVPKYEPFLVMNKAVAPWCDERFVGYGGNKIAYINQLQGSGFSFHVHPFGFVIHVPHVRTKAANVFVLEKHRGMSRMDDLRAQVEAEVQMGTYIPATLHCSEESEQMSQQWLHKQLELREEKLSEKELEQEGMSQEGKVVNEQG